VLAALALAAIMVRSFARNQVERIGVNNLFH
jgi:hypothetical protein